MQPVDAEVLDRRRDLARTRLDRIGSSIDLAEGSHTVEIRKPGFRTYVTQVDVQRGETAPLNVSLRNE